VLVGVDRTERVVKLSMNREPFLTFPSLYSGHAAVQVHRDFFPRFQAFFCGSVRCGYTRGPVHNRLILLKIAPKRNSPTPSRELTQRPQEASPTDRQRVCSGVGPEKRSEIEYSV
jgi:hypothetical protein